MKDSGRPEDFASAAMMRLVAAGLARMGIAPSFRAHAGAHVPRAEKRDILEEILQAHGAKTVLRLADALPHLPLDPILQALLRAKDLGDLLDRWHRLERFSHGRHFVEVVRRDGGAIGLTHRARDQGPPPSFSETLLVMAVLCQLVEVTTQEKVTLTTESGTVWRQGGLWLPEAGKDFTGTVILSPAPAQTIAKKVTAQGEVDFLNQLREKLVEDPLRRWTLAEVASELRMSQRTLQRRLAQRSLSFSQMLADARLKVAASYLCDPAGPGLAEIGFLAGFADQAHFARSFNRFVGTTPSSYRISFQG